MGMGRFVWSKGAIGLERRRWGMGGSYVFLWVDLVCAKLWRRAFWIPASFTGDRGFSRHNDWLKGLLRRFGNRERE